VELCDLCGSRFGFLYRNEPNTKDLIMIQIVVLPHPQLCPEGAVLEAEAGTSICDVLLANDIEIEHACEKSCACTTCHVIIREGFKSLAPSDELEDDAR
jgi:ferredoxin, 2Fe-2S